MARVIYALGTSLDGFVEDAQGNFDWAAPDEEAHRISNETAKQSSAFLFGRRMYETMEPYWPNATRSDSEIEREFATAYVETPRIVFSDSLRSVSKGSRIVRSADAVAEVTRLKNELDGHLDLAGPTLAATLVDLIDEFQMFVHPVLVGAGKPFFPPGIERVALRQLSARTLGSGVLHLRYTR